MTTNELSDLRIAVIGLGYVGLPLAIEFAKYFESVGFDINANRVDALSKGHDETREVKTSDLKDSTLTLTANAADIADCNFYVVTVPTPIDQSKQPDLTPLESASRTVGSLLQSGDIVVYESTVYPGATEEICVPILAEQSGLELNKDFFVGYSPERINPGDQNHKLRDIVKVTSGSTPEAALFIDEVYRKLIVAGTHLASSIKVAEAAKVIENTQRDLNIALINELSIIFRKIGIDTEAVLDAAATKWNFLRFTPGLVGGHCIGVDPYYLTHKAQQLGYFPQVILAGRRINDGMGAYVVSEVVKLMIKKKIQIADSRILVLGIAFKENCPDIRNTRVVDVVHEFIDYGSQVDIYDPHVDAVELQNEYGLTLVPELVAEAYDAVILAVPHAEIVELGAQQIRGLGKQNSILFEVKHSLEVASVDGRL